MIRAITKDEKPGLSEKNIKEEGDDILGYISNGDNTYFNAVFMPSYLWMPRAVSYLMYTEASKTVNIGGIKVSIKNNW